MAMIIDPRIHSSRIYPEMYPTAFLRYPLPLTCSMLICHCRVSRCYAIESHSTNRQWPEGVCQDISHKRLQHREELPVWALGDSISQVCTFALFKSVMSLRSIFSLLGTFHPSSQRRYGSVIRRAYRCARHSIPGR